jgi:hypothetical protein
MKERGRGSAEGRRACEQWENSLAGFEEERF